MHPRTLRYGPSQGRAGIPGGGHSGRGTASARGVEAAGPGVFLRAEGSQLTPCPRSGPKAALVGPRLHPGDHVQRHAGEVWSLPRPPIQSQFLPICHMGSVRET